MARTFKLLIVDQFSGPSPYSLQQNPRQFNDLVTEVMNAPRHSWRQPRLIDATEDWTPEDIGITAIREGDDGRAEIWQCCWDSS